MNQSEYNERFQKARKVEKLSLEEQNQFLRSENERLERENQALKLEIQNLTELFNYPTVAYGEQAGKYAV